MKHSMKRIRASTHVRQTGFVTILAAFALIAVVIFVLNRTYGILGVSSLSNRAQDDSVAAFFLAESGQERAYALLNSTGAFTDAKCTDVAKGPDSVPGSAFSLGGGTFSSTAISCDNSPTPVCGSACGSGTCGSCIVTVTGTVGGASRTVRRTFTLNQSTGGTFCNTANPLTPDCTNAATLPPPTGTNALPTWKSSVTNTSGSPAIAFFNMAASRQGNWSAATCSPATCQIVWSIDAQNSVDSVASMGNAIPLDASGPGASKTVYQTLNLNRNVVENGALFPGSGTLPGLAGTYSYWDDTNPSGGGSKTVGKSGDLLGVTNNGTKGLATTCATVGNNSQQVCDNWCANADTLVIGIAASAASTSDRFTSITFNTGGSNPQNIPLIPIGGRFPTATTAGAPPNVFAEIRYAHNPFYESGADVYSGAQFNGYIGTLFTGWIADKGKILNVTAAPTGLTFTPGKIIAGMDTGTTIVSVGTCPTTTTSTTTYPCTVNVDGPGSGGKQGAAYGPKSMTVASSVLTITSTPTGQQISASAPGNNIFVGGVLKGTINTFGTGNGSMTSSGQGTYNLVAENAVEPSSIQTDGTTITTTASSNLPTSKISSSIYLTVTAGNGTLAGSTTVPLSKTTALPLHGAQLSKPPSKPLSGATLKGGTYAFFDQLATTTQFSIVKTGGAEYWAAGFMCLSGVTQTPTETTSGPQKATGSTWTELVQ